ncbi:hypothetical protein HK099_006853 [Clydaea vesicula]|uniref:Brix domain-containing protein n=1 Tax=Clydaea vesicula TaxID=447962 RepID=A0AAD5XU17_9FUNG|nr:hypothetical protein HK099_006853 [Clydaea vesicula]
MARQGRKKKRTHQVVVDEEVVKSNKSFVLKHGKVSPSLIQLTRDVRKIMEPNTASKLKERNSNKIRDFVDLAGPYGVSHILIFSKTKSSINLRVGRFPRGPTLSFKVLTYSLTKDIHDMQLRPKSSFLNFKTAPLVVLNNFSGNEKQIKLMSVIFQNMFPPINVQKMKLTEARRVVLFNYNDQTKTVDLRHYSVNVKLAGVTKSVKSILQTNVENLHEYNDISEFILKGAFASESDIEDQDSTMKLPDDFGKGNAKSSHRAIRLQELGPRMKLKLIKIQEGLCGGEVIHHELRNSEEKKDEKERDDESLHSNNDDDSDDDSDDDEDLDMMDDVDDGDDEEGVESDSDSN